MLWRLPVSLYASHSAGSAGHLAFFPRHRLPEATICILSLRGRNASIGSGADAGPSLLSVARCFLLPHRNLFSPGAPTDNRWSKNTGFEVPRCCQHNKSTCVLRDQPNSHITTPCPARRRSPSTSCCCPPLLRIQEILVYRSSALLVDIYPASDRQGLSDPHRLAIPKTAQWNSNFAQQTSSATLVTITYCPIPCCSAKSTTRCIIVNVTAPKLTWRQSSAADGLTAKRLSSQTREHSGAGSPRSSSENVSFSI